jgi:hypothetical protein
MNIYDYIHAYLKDFLGKPMPALQNANPDLKALQNQIHNCSKGAKFIHTRCAIRTLRLRKFPAGFCFVRRCTLEQHGLYMEHGGPATTIPSFFNLIVVQYLQTSPNIWNRYHKKKGKQV